MNWILIGTLAGLLMTGTFETEEACLGKKAIIEKMKDNKVVQLACHDNRSLGVSPNVMTNCVRFDGSRC